MKKLNTKNFLLLCSLLLSTYSFSQTKDPRSQQIRANVVPGQKLPEYKAVFNPTLPTTANRVLAPGIVDGPDVRMFPSSNVQAEVTIALNKSNPLNLLASANTLNGPYAYNQGFYASLDGGATWNGADVLQKIITTQVYGDPTVSFSNDNTAFMTSINAGGGYWFQRSIDGGLNWSKGVRGDVGTGYDKGMSASDEVSTSPYVNYFYHSWTDFNSGGGAVVFNKSIDKGVTFTPKITLRSATTGFGQGTNVQTGPNGEVYVCWADHTTVTPPYAATGMGFTRSIDGGTTFDAYRVIFPYTGIRVDGYSSTFGYTRVNDFPAMAVDKSNKLSRGNIYVVYAGKLNGTGKGTIYVSVSKNQGTTWTPSKAISIAPATQAFFPWIAVDDSTGGVFVSYYAFDQATGYSTNTYVAGSPNGGKTWITQKASDVPHITAPIDNVNFAYGYAGDYIGITAYAGKLYPVWMDNRNGTWQVYCSPMTVSAVLTGVAQTTTDAQSAATAESSKKLSISPNPFTGVIRISLPNTGITSVKLYNQSGVLVKQWSNPSSGSLNVGELAKGIYILKATGSDNKLYTQKVVKE